MDKKSQRAIIRERLKYNDFQNDTNSKQIVNQLINLDVIKNAKVILSYLPLDYEVNVSLFNRINRYICFPVIKGDNMEAYLPFDGKLVKNQYGILQPDVKNSLFIDKDNIDVAIVPCLAYDDKLNRLGHGKGYYDKYLANSNIYKICVGFSKQQLEEIVVDQYDVKMDMIVNENGIIVRKL